MSNDGSRFDPRFDRAYQPGYDGGPETIEPPLAGGARPKAADGTAASSAIETDRETSAAIVSPLTGSAAVDSEPGLQELREPDTELDEAPPPLRNRYLIALGALAVALLIIGIVVIGFVRTMFDNRTEDLDYVTVQLLLVSGPIAIGLAIAIGASFLMILGLRSRSGS